MPRRAVLAPLLAAVAAAVAVPWTGGVVAQPPAASRAPAAGCDAWAPGPSVPPAALRAALRRLPPQPLGAARSVDAELADVAREVPGGFAGVYVEAAASVDPPPGSAARPARVIRLVRPAARAAALAALAPRLARYDAGHADLSGARVLPARWDFAQLYDWQRYIGARVGGRVRVALSDIDEVENRIVLGVGTEPERQALGSELAALGAPCGLVEVVLVQFVRPRVGRAPAG